MLKAVKEATKIQRALNVRVFKLKSIHTEVERLKTKQYSKNRIMSLNGELKLLSTKLTDFEEKAGNRHKLTNKRINSSTLLEEERFRKQMQGKFVSKLEILGQMLHDWELAEGAIEDSDMLSEVVKDMLENSHRIDAWMNERTRFMHLRTTQAKSKARDADHITSSIRPTSRRGPTSTPRTTPSSSASGNARLTSHSKIKSTSSTSRFTPAVSHHKTPLSGTSHNSQPKDQVLGKEKSPTISIEAPELALLDNPFGDLLSDTPVLKENRSRF